MSYCICDYSVEKLYIDTDILKDLETALTYRPTVGYLVANIGPYRILDTDLRNSRSVYIYKPIYLLSPLSLRTAERILSWDKVEIILILIYSGIGPL